MLSAIYTTQPVYKMSRVFKFGRKFWKCVKRIEWKFNTLSLSKSDAFGEFGEQHIAKGHIFSHVYGEKIVKKGIFNFCIIKQSFFF